MKSIRMNFLCVALMASLALGARTTLSYEVRFDTAGHYADVCMYYSAATPTQTLRLQMPVWAPGYYVIEDYPKHLVDFRAVDASGRDVAWSKQGKSEWDIPSPQAGMKVTWRIYSNERTVAGCRVEGGMAFLSLGGICMYPVDGKDEPVEITFIRPSNWSKLTTGLIHEEGDRYRARNYDELYDCPVLLGNHRLEEFDLQGHHYSVAFLKANGLDAPTFVSYIKRIVTAATEVMGDVPYDNYCFLLLDEGEGGLEHANSQADYTNGNFHFTLQGEYMRMMSFIAHEYFHLYNVKRIRPIELGPFDYQREVFTPLLWMSEGLTVYYEYQILLRAGLMKPEEVLSMSSWAIRAIELREGHRHMSLRQSSYDIWLNFFNHDENGPATRISYYEKGPIIAMLMDIEILRLTKGKRSLDDLMRALYNNYYKKLNRGFTEEEFWQTCAQIAGTPLKEMRRLVDTTDEIDYDRLLAPVGMSLDRATMQMKMKSDATPEQLSLREKWCSGKR